MVAVKHTHQVFLIDKRKKTNGVEKGQIYLCLRKYVSFDIFCGGYLELLLWKKKMLRIIAQDKAYYYWQLLIRKFKLIKNVELMFFFLKETLLANVDRHKSSTYIMHVLYHLA